MVIAFQHRRLLITFTRNEQVHLGRGRTRQRLDSPAGDGELVEVDGGAAVAALNRSELPYHLTLLVEKG